MAQVSEPLPSQEKCMAFQCESFVIVITKTVAMILAVYPVPTYMF
jgi:hypothetical protein